MANARLSRQQVEVIGNLATNLRVGGQSLMVAGDAQNGNLRVHGVTLEYMTKISPETPNSDIGIDHSVALSVVRNLSVSSTITVSQDLESNYIFESASSIIGVDDSLSLNQTLNKTLTSTLTLGHSVNLAMVKATSSTVGISQSVSVSVVRNVSASSTLSLQQLGFAPSHPFPSNTIGVDHSVSVRKILNRSVSQDINVSQDWIRAGATRVGCFSVLSGWVWVRNPLTGLPLEEWREWTQTVEVEHIQGPTQIYESAGNTLTLGQSVSTQNIFNQSPESNIALSHTDSYTNLTDDVISIYSPFVGSTTNPDNPTPPPVTQPPQTRSSIILSYPAVTPTLTLTLRGPELGNTSDFSTQRINRESRGGYLVVYRDSIWPKVKHLKFSFVGLTETEGQELITFIETSIGKPVKLIDWTGREFTGIITSTQSPIVRNRDTCNLSAELEFELLSGT